MTQRAVSALDLCLRGEHCMCYDDLNSKIPKQCCQKHVKGSNSTFNISLQDKH